MSGTVQRCGELEIVLPRETAEACCEWIRETLDAEPVWLEQPGHPLVVLHVYHEQPAILQGWAGRLQEVFAIQRLGVRTCREEEWTTFWRHHFHTTDIGRRLRTVPVWEAIPDRKRINLRLDPGLSFGTGCHFTTRFCLEALEAACAALQPASMLDAGAGSGILAIAAYKMGVRRVEAFDFDPVCVEQFPKNRRLNRVPKEAIRFVQANVLGKGWGRPAFDVVCANILAHILIASAPALLRATRKRLILAGIREVEADDVANTFLSLGAREITRDGDGIWCGLVFEPAGKR